jgi:thioesterase domain-containing protein
MATRLQKAGDEVASLILLDSSAVPTTDPSEGIRAVDVLGALGIEGHLVDAHAEQLGNLTTETISDVLAEIEDMPPGLDSTQVQRLVAAAEHNVRLSQHHSPAVFDGDLLFFSADRDHPGSTVASDSWAPFVRRSTQIRLPFTHWQMCSPAALKQAGPVIADHVESQHGSISSDQGNGS